MYTSKQVQIEKRFIVQSDEKQGVFGVEIGKVLSLEVCDTRGGVCIELLNDTPGSVDKHQPGRMGDIRREKCRRCLVFLKTGETKARKRKFKKTKKISKKVLHFFEF